MKRPCKNWQGISKPTLKPERLVIATAFLLLFSSGCAHIPRGYPGWTQVGTASWYGKEFHGKPTASGETYNMYSITAAHNTLPLGTRCLVTNLDNGNSCVVTINDRGPFVGGRIIDLSYGAALRLGIADQGLATVRIQVLDALPAYICTYTLQFGAYTDRDNAMTMAERLKALKYAPNIELAQAHGQTFYRVRLGKFTSLDRAQYVAKGFDSAGFPCIVTAL